MSTTIHIEQVTEFAPHNFCAEASDLGFAPGEWPSRLETTLGNKQPFLLSFHDGEGACYAQALGCITLKIFND